MHPDLNMVHFPSQGSLLMTRAQHSRSSWRQPAPWGTTTASPTPTLRLSSRATASMESKYLFLPLAKSSFLLWHKYTGADGLKKRKVKTTWFLVVDITSVAAVGPARLQWHFLFWFTGESSCSAHHDSTTSSKTAQWNTAKTNTPTTKSRGSSRTTCECYLDLCPSSQHPYTAVRKQRRWFHNICTVVGLVGSSKTWILHSNSTYLHTWLSANRTLCSRWGVHPANTVSSHSAPRVWLNESGKCVLLL